MPDPQLEQIEEPWQRESGGGGISRVMRSGSVFEQAGVNFSHVTGDKLPRTATAKRPELEGRRFDSKKIFQLLLRDAETGVEEARIDVTIDLAFINDF